MQINSFIQTQIIYLKAIFRSFYDAEVYKEAAYNWSGRGLKYLLVLGFLSSLIVSYKWISQINKLDGNYVAAGFVNMVVTDTGLSFEENLNNFLKIIAQVPKLKIEDGKAIFEGPEPYFIKDAKGNDIAVIDTSGEFNSLAQTNANLLITQTRAMFRHNGMEHIYYLHEIDLKLGIGKENINTLLFIFSQVPHMYIENSQMRTKDGNYHTIKDRSGKTIAVIDPSVVQIDYKNVEVPIFISANEIFIKPIAQDGKMAIGIASLNKDALYNIVINAVNLMKKFFKWFMLLAGIPLFTAITFCFTAVMAALYAFATMPFVAMRTQGAKVPYNVIMRIMCLAVTPVVVLNLVLPPLFSSQSLIYFVMSIGYVYFAVKAVFSEEKS